MTDSQPVPATGFSPTPSPAPQVRSRRAILAGALGGIGALAATVIGGAARVQAAAGSPLIIGSSTNNAGTSNTILSTSSSVVAFELIQNGPGTALMGYVTPGSGGTRGVYGRSNSPNGDGVQARNAGAAGTGAAIRAFGGNNDGVLAQSISPSGVAVYGDAAAVSGLNTGAWGASRSPDGVGVVGWATATSGMNVGVFGLSDSPDGLAGAFSGDVFVDGILDAAAASAAIKSFKIDHPLDPANKYLVHSCVESNERLNVYSGTARVGANGEATVELPTYFAGLNRDARYQLTAVGAAMPGLHIGRELANGSFVIAGAEPRSKVCWQVVGARQDAYAEAHPLQVEPEKAASERGRYLHPIELGQPESKGIGRIPVRKAIAVSLDH